MARSQLILFQLPGVLRSGAFLLASFLLLAGCDDTIAPKPAKTLDGINHTFASGIPEEANPPAVAELPPEERRKLHRQFLNNMRAFRKAALSASSWREADRRTRALLKESSPYAQYMREQLAADWMLKRWLLEGDSSPQKQEAVAFYTNLMLENQNPQAQIIQPALQQLKGKWSEKRIAKAASATTRRAKKFMQGEAYQLARESELETAQNLRAQESQKALRNSSNHHHLRLTEAIDQLEAMSASSQ